jgi:hypothetical protein
MTLVRAAISSWTANASPFMLAGKYCLAVLDRSWK